MSNYERSGTLCQLPSRQGKSQEQVRRVAQDADGLAVTVNNL